MYFLISLPKKKLKWFKFKGFADDKLIFVQIVSFVFDRKENILGKGENAGVFPRIVSKHGIVWKRNDFLPENEF